MGLLRAAYRVNQLLHSSNYSHGIFLAQRNILPCPSINAGTGSEQPVKGQYSPGCQFLQTLSYSATAASSCSSSEQSMLDKFEKWVAETGRVYKNPIEKAMRFKIFRDNMEYYEAFNKQPGITFTIGLTQYSDHTYEERRSMKRFNGYLRYYSDFMESASNFSASMEATTTSSTDGIFTFTSKPASLMDAVNGEGHLKNGNSALSLMDRGDVCGRNRVFKWGPSAGHLKPIFNKPINSASFTKPEKDNLGQSFGVSSLDFKKIALNATLRTAKRRIALSVKYKHVCNAPMHAGCMDKKWKKVYGNEMLDSSGDVLMAEVCEATRQKNHGRGC